MFLRKKVLSILVMGLLLVSQRSTAKPYSIISEKYSHRFSYVGNKYDNGYSEVRFNEVLGVVESIYGPIILALGGKLKILKDWSDGAVNAWAFRLGSEYWLEVPGGMSRYYLINEEAFILTLCHELGHLLGGEPKSGEISYEGQSDYFSTNSCIRKLLRGIEPIGLETYENEVVQKCSGEAEEVLCLRSTLGALKLTSYYAEISNQSFPKLSTPSQSQVTTTLSSHPEAQCRLDTIVAGYFSYPRPSCWFFDQKSPLLF